MFSIPGGLTLGSILLGAALALVVLLFLARPFAAREDQATRLGREEIDALFLRKESLLRQIRELDEDFEAAKIAPELYRHTRPQRVRQAAGMMKQLDDLGYVESTVRAADTDDQSVDAQIEAAVQRLRAPEPIDKQIEATAQADDSTRFCPQCGNRIEPDDRFCSKCGHALIPTARVAEA